MSSRSFYPVFLAFFAGVFAASVLPISLPIIGAAAIMVSSALLIALRGKGRAVLAVCAASMAAFALGFVRVELFEVDHHPLDESVAEEIALEGSVCSEPEEKEKSLRYRFCPDGTEDKVIVTAGLYPAYAYGDRLSIAGKLSLPKNFESYEGGPEFDYVSHLAKDGVRYTMFYPKAEKVGEGGGDPVTAALFGIKGAFTGKMRSLFPEPESSLLGGILLGERDSLPEDVTEDFKTAGLVHILVLSGYNVTIVAESLMEAFSFLPRSLGRSLGALSIVLFALMTGAGATTVRASIMALVLILARSTARRYDVTRALLVAALFMVLHNPMILAFDISFQLSFIATLGIIYVAPLVSDRLGFVTERWKVREIVATTVGTQVAVVPFLMHSMGNVSLISLATNLLVLPAIPYAMLLGFLAVMAGFVSRLAALPLVLAAGAILSYTISVAHVSALVPFASIRMTASAFALAVMYAVLASVLIRAWRRRGSSPRSAS